MNKRRQLFRLSTMKLSLAAIVFDSIFMAVSVWNETWPLDPLIYAGIRLCLTFMSMGARLLQQGETTSDCPRRAMRKFFSRRESA
ncbi:holin [Salmonella enterica]|uniref:Holin n=10 Tax=Salmonella enterica TaxID=28901 RepID=A0A5Y3Q820_SALER|nr:holin [Salmonella enterica subsp. arizonae]EAA7489479.1 holin [Salmonella enterica]EAB9740760.1 holin [Salmonella enterica subsp. diarizonae]EAU5131754.1 holin [Salmonella enterica subsp. enterica serovar Oranienburg]EAW1633434.1 holin [Salmonella enterica subsp. enterica]EBE3722354.1 holin [Salmonella enterica subsp. diarizonae serovar 42:l,v:1,5,7]EBK2688459.1 holin [Salmonella enterica subsp. enterica serovar Newport]EBQ6006644.1 holin [Salmonella enterica subsp. enterica serovar Berke